MDNVGYALGVVQYGGHPPSGKPWKGLGPGVFEIAEDDDPEPTGRCTRYGSVKRYTCCTLSRRSRLLVSATARTDVELVARRLKDAMQDYEERYGKETD